MFSVALVILSAIQLGCVVWLWRGSRGQIMPHRPSALLVLVGLGLAYDSAVFGTGAALGEGALLHALSVGRFVGHVALTPLLAVWAANQFGLRRLWSWTAAAVLITWGAAADLLHLDLEPRHWADTLRCSPSTPHGPPIPALIVSAIVLAAGIRLWHSNSWPWLTLGSITLIATAAVAFTVPALGNLGEAVLFLAIVATAVHGYFSPA